MKKFNKIIAIILVLTMIVSLPLNVSNAQGVSKENFDETLSDELDYEINEEGLTVETELSLEESEYIQENSFQLDNSTQEKDVEHVEVNLDLTLDEYEDSRLISIETDSDGNTVEKEYQVVIEEADEEKIIATFIDLSTGEEYTYNSYRVISLVCSGNSNWYWYRQSIVRCFICNRVGSSYSRSYICFLF